MKKRTLKYLLTALLCTTMAQNSSGMATTTLTTAAKYGISGACSLAELLATSVPIIGTLLKKPQVPNLEKLADTQSSLEASTTIVPYITHLAAERGLNNIKVIVDNCHSGYAMDTDNAIIYITPEDYLDLKSLLQNKSRSSEEEEKLHMHTGFIHHEITHGLRKSLQRIQLWNTTAGTIGALALSTTLSHLITKHIPIINTNFVLHNSFKIIRSALTFHLALHLIRSKITHSNFYNQYEEIQADDGIPNQKELLEAQANFHKLHHDKHLERIEYIKMDATPESIKVSGYNRVQLFAMNIIPTTWLSNPFIMNCMLDTHSSTHPAPKVREQRFRNRIAKIDKKIVRYEEL